MCELPGSTRVPPPPSPSRGRLTPSTLSRLVRTGLTKACTPPMLPSPRSLSGPMCDTLGPRQVLATSTARCPEAEAWCVLQGEQGVSSAHACGESGAGSSGESPPVEVYTVV